MGIDVNMLSDHSLPTHSGKALVAEFEKRFQCTVRFYKDLSENEEGWVLTGFYNEEGDVEEEWKTQNSLEFYYPSKIPGESKTIFIQGPIAEVSINSWGQRWFSFIFALADYPSLEKDHPYITTHRKKIFEFIKQIGGTRVLFEGDWSFYAHDDEKNEDPFAEYGHYLSFDEIIERVKKKGDAVFYYPVTKQQWKAVNEAKRSYGILVDDFKDLE
jgi:hypothetical protein